MPVARAWIVVLLGACLLWLAGAQPVRAEPRIALVIANAKYKGDLSPLSNPVNDARLIAKSLEAVGFEVLRLDNGSQKDMKRAIADFGAALERAGPDATGLFYYAGHGLQVDGINYLVPVSAEIAREADVDLESVAADTVLKQMEYAGIATSIVILDACRNNPLARSFRSASRGLARMDAPNGSFVAYSTAPGDVAADGEGRNSPFAQALAVEMTRPDQAIEETFRNVRAHVMTATEKKQVPWDSSSMVTPFYFAGAKAPTTGASPDLVFWDSIKNSSNPAEYEAYLRTFPEGDFVPLAQTRLRDLGGQQAQGAGAVGTAETSATPAQATPAQAAPAEAAPDEVAAMTVPEADEGAPESPLPDGTIVLSSAVRSELERYLAAVATMPSVYGQKKFAFFYVSEDGRHAGSFRCRAEAAEDGDCPRSDIAAGSTYQSREKARKACEAKAQSACVYLFRDDEPQTRYR